MKHLLKVILVAVVILYTIIGAATGIYSGPRLAPEADKAKYRMTPRKWILSIAGVVVFAAVLAWLVEGRLW